MSSTRTAVDEYQDDLFETPIPPEIRVVKPQAKDEAQSSLVFRSDSMQPSPVEKTSEAVLEPLANRQPVQPPRTVIRLPPPPSRESPFKVLQQWEGMVSSDPSYNGDFVAIVRDLTNPSFPDEKVTFSIEEVSEADRSLISPGAIFYWFIGYEKTEWGQIKRVSLLRFRRLPKWTANELEAARRRSDRIASLLGLGS
jgi:hypothetical protein